VGRVLDTIGVGFDGQRRIAMTLQSGPSTSIIPSIGRNLFAIAITWVVGLVLVQVGLRALGGWPAAEVGQLLSFVFGVAMSLRINATLAAYLWSAMVAYSVSELAIHLYFGIRAAQGAPAHFAVIAAAVVGVTTGTLLTRSRRDLTLT
jgi:hypothetical protein